jgi:2-dehydro-3-deoxyphosphogluconate aldolase/(4S)-4-hydroxy-2-oxoglutarate aldolase
VRELIAERGGAGPPYVGMGTVTTAERARAAVAAGAEFLVTPNIDEEVARIARDARLYLVIGALTPSEIVAAKALGADLVKVYPLPPVGGPAYLAVVRQPLGDVGPMLAGGGFGIEEIPAYRAAGAVAFGIGAPLIGGDPQETQARIARALELARG